jgi:heat shock protein HslJ
VKPFALKTKLRVVLTAAALLASIACSDSASGPSDADPLAGTTWALQSLGGNPLLAGSTVDLSLGLDVQGRLGGSSGCNRYFGSYAVSGTALSTSRMGMTLMACDPDVMTQESRYVGLLEQASTYRLAGSQLDIVSRDGSILRFARR